jgi:hypothetical protein
MRIATMLSDAFGRAVSFLPNVLAALIILVVGLLIAKILEVGTRRGLAAVGLHSRAGVRKLVGEQGTLERVPRVSGRIVYWVLALVTVGVAVDALHLAWLSAGVARVLAYVPRVLAACVIGAVGYIAGNFLYRETARKEGASASWPRLLRGAIFAFAAFMALQELGIATAIVTIAFTVGLSAMAVAAALAFGLGNRELAGRMTRDWYERRGPRYRQYEPTMGERAREERGEQEPPTRPHH